MRRILVVLALAAFLAGTTTSFAQTLAPSVNVALKTLEQWQFTLGGQVDQPFGFALLESKDVVFVYGIRATGTSSAPDFRSAIARISFADGYPDWFAADSTGTAGLGVVLTPNGKHVAWTSYQLYRTGTAFRISTIDGADVVRKEIPSTASSVNLSQTPYHNMVVGFEASNENPRVLFFDSTGSVVRSFVYAPLAQAIISGTVQGDSLWIQGRYDGGKSSFVALYNIVDGTQYWRREFPNHIRIRMDVDSKGNAYLFGSRVDLASQTDYRMYFVFSVLDQSGNVLLEKTWLPRTETSIEANVSNWVAFITLDPEERFLAVGGNVQRDTTNTGRNMPYLAILEASTGNTSLTLSWLYRSSSPVNNLEDGKFTSDRRLILQGHTFNGGSGTGYLTVQSFIATGVEQIGDQSLVTSYLLRQNYPNPFNPRTTIEFEIPEHSFVKLTIMNLLGQELETLVSEELSAGVHRTMWDATRFPSGTYLYHVETPKFHAAKMMVLVK